MKVLKNIAVGLLSFFLFIAIFVFGILFEIKSTVLSPHFVTARINEIDTVKLMDEFVDFKSSPETENTLEKIKLIIPKIEPVIKERTNVFVYSVYDYLLDKKQEPDIKGALGDSFLNPEFVDSVLAEVSFPELIDVITQPKEGEEGLPVEFVNAIKDVVTDLEPEIKEQTAEISRPVFEYILGKSQKIDMTRVLRDTVLNEDFMVPLIEKLDLSAIAEELLTQQLTDKIPPDMEYLTKHIGSALNAIEPTIKTELKKAAGPFLDYLTGETQHLSIQISLDKVVNTLEENLKDDFLTTPPAEYADLSQTELNQIFNESFSGKLSDILPSTFEIDETIISSEIAGNFSGAITDMEDSLTEIRNEIDNVVLEMEEPLLNAREYISYFQLAFTLFIVFIVLMLLGIILILRDVRAITRKIGVPLLIYGAIEYAGIWVARYFLNGKIPMPDIPVGVQNWISNLASKFMRPLEIFSLSLLIIGLALTIVSFIYKRGQKEQEAITADQP